MNTSTCYSSAGNIEDPEVFDNLRRVIREEKPELIEDFSIEWLDEQFRKWAVNEKKENKQEGGNTG